MPDRPTAVICAERALRIVSAILRQAMAGPGYAAAFADRRVASVERRG